MLRWEKTNSRPSRKILSPGLLESLIASGRYSLTCRHWLRLEESFQVQKWLLKKIEGQYRRNVTGSNHDRKGQYGVLGQQVEPWSDIIGDLMEQVEPVADCPGIDQEPVPERHLEPFLRRKHRDIYESSGS